MTGARVLRFVLALACLAGAFAVPTIVLGAASDDGRAAAAGSSRSFEAFSLQRPVERIAAPQRTVEVPALRRAVPLPAMKSPRRRSGNRRPAAARRTLRPSSPPPTTIATPVRVPSRPPVSAPAPLDRSRVTAPAPARPAPAPRPVAPAPAERSRPAPDDFDERESFDSTG